MYSNHVVESDAWQEQPRALHHGRKILMIPDAATYITRTESVVRKLFEGIQSYTELLNPLRGTTFVTDETDLAKLEAELDAWARRNEAKLAAALEAQRKYSQEAFAMSTLCGAVLQVAAKAIECYSAVQTVSPALEPIVGNSGSVVPFCIGREVHGVPIGLVIFAGRNQHTHYNEPILNRVNVAVFERLAQIPGHGALKDPAMDLSNPLLDSYASNVTFLLGWRSYETYEYDLKSLLGI